MKNHTLPQHHNPMDKNRFSTFNINHSRRVIQHELLFFVIRPGTMVQTIGIIEQMMNTQSTVHIVCTLRLKLATVFGST